MENNKSVTAVEWLVNHWKKLKSEGEKMSWQQIIDITELTKAMEKEQTLLFSEKYDEYVFRGGSATAEEYYEETFKSE